MLRKYVCEICPTGYNEFSHLKRHYTIMHSDAQFPQNLIDDHEAELTCPICQKRLGCIASREKHVKMHSGMKMFRLL